MGKGKEGKMNCPFKNGQIVNWEQVEKGVAKSRPRMGGIGHVFPQQSTTTNQKKWEEKLAEYFVDNQIRQLF
jgi:hypothetical protein